MAKTESPRPIKAIPPYLPYETFTKAVSHLKDTVVPSRIDKDAFPNDLHTLQRGQVQSALKFLGLIDGQEHTKEGLRSLVGAYGTDKWREALTEHVFEKYDNIIGEVDLDTATQRQLDERFQSAGMSGQMLMKAVRFYLALLTDAGMTFSPHLGRGRRNGSTGAPRAKKAAAKRNKQPARAGSKKTEKPAGANGDAGTTNAAPEGLIDIPIPLGAQAAFIRIPTAITKKQMLLVKAAYGVVEAMAAQNDPDE